MIKKYMDSAMRTVTGVLYIICVCTAVYGNLNLRQCVGDKMIVLCISAVIAAGIVFLCRSMKRLAIMQGRYFPVAAWGAFLTAFLLRLVMLFLWNTEPVSDFGKTFDIAYDMCGVSFSDIPSYLKETAPFYYYEWPMHIPFILFEYFILKVFGGGVFGIQVASAFFGAASCFVLCFVGKGLYDAGCGLVAGFLYAFLPVSVLFTGVLSNQHIATFFFLSALYFIVCRPAKKRYINLLLAGICVAVSHLMRPEMQVMAVAYVCFEIYRVIRCKSVGKKEITGFIINVFVPVVISLGIVAGVSFVITSSGIAGKSVMTGNLKYKIATGLNRESGGQWNEADMKEVNNEKLLEQYIKERAVLPGLAGFMMEKLSRQYGTYSYLWCAPKDGTHGKKLYREITNIAMLAVFILILYGALKRFFKISPGEVFLMIITIGYFLTFAIIEIQDRYNYFMIPVFILMACIGLVGNDK